MLKRLKQRILMLREGKTLQSSHKLINKKSPVEERNLSKGLTSLRRWRSGSTIATNAYYAIIQVI